MCCGWTQLGLSAASQDADTISITADLAARVSPLSPEIAGSGDSAAASICLISSESPDSAALSGSVELLEGVSEACAR